ncbi:MAG: PIN domain-containing protein [Nanoarchaeota archaeon]
MKILIDTNIIIAALIKNNKAREVILSGKFEFVSPEFVLEEVNKYKKYICDKAKISSEVLDLVVNIIFEKITLVPKEEYDEFIEESREIMERDVKDIPYVACYFAMNCNYLWTNDLDFTGKKELKLISIKELLELIN